LKYRNEAGPTCQSQQLIKTLATGYRSPVHAHAMAAGHAPEARAPPATRSAPWRLCCPCALTKTRPYLLEAEAKEPFSSSHSPSLPLLSRRAATLLCCGRRRAADSSRLLPSLGASRRCRADTFVPGANRRPARPLRAPRHRLPSPRGRHGGQPSPATEPVPFDHPELRRRTTVLDNSTNPTG
jgi:hypothetical protein